MKTIDDLNKIKQEMQPRVRLDRREGDGTRVVVGMATCGIAAGARPVLNALAEEVSKRGLNDVTVCQTGCIGVCMFEPLVEVYSPGGEKVTYVNMTPEKAAKIVEEHIVNNRVVTEYTIGANL